MLMLLVRHALTPKTGRILTGWLPGISLSEEGRRQVDGLAERLAPVPVEAVYASPITRTMETARPIAAARGLRVRVRRSLGEVRYGEWEGRHLSALARTTLWRQVLARPSSVRFPGGETLREVQARAVDAVEAIREEHPHGTVAAVTHADVIRVLVAHYAGIHLDLYQRLAIPTASVSVLALGDGGPRILRLADTGTLAGFGRGPEGGGGRRR